MAIGFFGMTRMCTGACGLTSLNAMQVSLSHGTAARGDFVTGTQCGRGGDVAHSSKTTVAGISLRMILPKIVSPPGLAAAAFSTSDIVTNSRRWWCPRWLIWVAARVDRAVDSRA
eukprot:2766734-Prymnesium_polylepis.1